MEEVLILLEIFLYICMHYLLLQQFEMIALTEDKIIWD